MLKKIILIGLLFAAPMATRGQQVVHADLNTLISNLRNAMPGMNSNAFVVPTFQQMDRFGSVFSAILDSNYMLADSLAQTLQYRLYEWYDSSNSDTRYYVLKEPSSETNGGVALGWGTFIFYPDGEDEVTVEVPHPYWDTNTWKVGFTAFQRLRTKFFLMAGTHRYANGQNPAPADVAHNTQNMFHIVHQKVSPKAVHALQVHGFSRSGHPGYPDVILSNGSSQPPPIIDSLGLAIQGQGFSVGIFDGVNWSDLGATTNKQGQYSRSHGYSFIHMELEYFIRNNSTHWKKINTALAQTFLLPLSIRLNRGGPQESESNILFYPNPFNSTISFSVFIEKQGTVRFEIIDSSGKLIRTLMSGYQSRGLHNLHWDGLDREQQRIASGVYFAVLRSNESISVERVVYLK